MIPDWANGIMMLTGKNSTPTTDPCEQDGGSYHPAWGAMSLAFSWFPAFYGFFLLCGKTFGSSDNFTTGCLSFILIPVRFILWPLLVPIGM